MMTDEEWDADRDRREEISLRLDKETLADMM